MARSKFNKFMNDHYEKKYEFKEELKEYSKVVDYLKDLLMNSYSNNDVFNKDLLVLISFVEDFFVEGFKAGIIDNSNVNVIIGRLSNNVVSISPAPQYVNRGIYSDDGILYINGHFHKFVNQAESLSKIDTRRLYMFRELAKNSLGIYEFDRTMNDYVRKFGYQIDKLNNGSVEASNLTVEIFERGFKLIESALAKEVASFLAYSIVNNLNAKDVFMSDDVFIYPTLLLARDYYKDDSSSSSEVLRRFAHESFGSNIKKKMMMFAEKVDVNDLNYVILYMGNIVGHVYEDKLKFDSISIDDSIEYIKFYLNRIEFKVKDESLSNEDSKKKILVTNDISLKALKEEELIKTLMDACDHLYEKYKSDNNVIVENQDVIVIGDNDMNQEEVVENDEPTEAKEDETLFSVADEEDKEIVEEEVKEEDNSSQDEVVPDTVEDKDDESSVSEEESEKVEEEIKEEENTSQDEAVSETEEENDDKDFIEGVESIEDALQKKKDSLMSSVFPPHISIIERK